MTPQYRFAPTLARLLGVLLTACLWHADFALAQASTCDPTKASCIPAPGGGGGSCTPLQQALHQCTPGGGAGGGGLGDGGGGAAPMCSAPPGGNPSCGGGPATTASNGPSSGAGNPINLLNGNKYQEETDLPALPGVLGLELRRYYNSQGNHPGLLGANWRMSYESVLYDFGGEIQILQADGRRLMFERGIGAHATLCSSPQPQDGQVRIEAPADGRGPPTYHWRWADGRTLTFSGGSGGGFPLQAITAASGERLTLSYGPSGELTNIRDPQGRKLVFIYAGAAETAAQHRSRALKAIDTPLGRLTYTQDSLGRLTEVAQAKDANSAPYLTRLYHYEDRYNGGHPLALTGISIRGADPQTGQINVQRLSTYAYNSAGLAILSTKGRPKEVKDGKQTPDTGIEQVEVQYLVKALPVDSKVDRKTGEVIPTQFGRAILTNSLGQQTQVTSAVIGGHYRLVEMRGAGCSTCGPTDTRYAYDRAGLLMRATQLDRDGRPIRSEITELDKYGRTARMGLQTYAGGKAESTRWIERYEYPDVTYRDGSVAVAPRPSLIARPSVVEGREHTVATSYNEFGQVTQAKESGFIPGSVPRSGSPISRSISYGYTTIHAVSLLGRIDGPGTKGPLDNPTDSDVTLISYDAEGVELEVVAPGNAITRIERRDAAGRHNVFSFDDGRRLVRNEMIYTADGKRQSVEETAWLRQADGATDPASELHRRTRYEYDTYTRLVAIVRPDGTRVGTETDLAGRALRFVSADGSQVVIGRDTESRLVMAERDDGGGHPLQRLRLGYADAPGSRVSSVEDDLGTIAAFNYNESAVHNARPSVVEHPFGRITRYFYNASGSIIEQTLASGTTNAVDRQYLFDAEQRVTGEMASIRSDNYRAQAAQYDDFGRKVLFASPEHGLNRYVWDASDRLIARTDESGHVSRFVYDAAGRLMTAGVDHQPDLARYRYEGRLQIEERSTYDGLPEHVKEVRSSRHDAFGQTVSEEHWQAVPSGADRSISVVAAAPTLGFMTRTDYRYDRASGRLVEKTVTDHQGRAHVIGYEWNAKTGHLAAVSFNGQRAVGSIEGTTLGGITAMTWGSGVTERLTRDDRGRLVDKTVQPAAGVPPLLHMAWHYDATNHLVRSEVAGVLREYRYDFGGRLIGDVEGGKHLAELEYDALGNRTGSVVDKRQIAYWYQGGKLVAEEAETPKPSWLLGYTATGAPMLRRALALSADVSLLRTQYDTAGRPVTIGGTAGTRSSVRYGWGMRGERTSKTVDGQTTWFLYEDAADQGIAGLRLAAEAAGDGAIVSHYLYIEGRPVARIDTPEIDSSVGRAWFNVKHAVLGWFGRKPLADAHVYAVHTDQRGAPVAATDDAGRVVWQADAQAFGKATPKVQRITMNLRLPGQYFDAETGTHYNMQRDYDPSTGRYLTPDPLSADPWLDLGRVSQLTGDNAYAYVSGNPLTQIDPQGLYESDVHYYMTYFLAIVAGMGADDARTMALAAQYIDDNPQTSPTPDGSGTLEKVTSTFHNQPQLKDYHFVLSGADGITLAAYANNTVTNPDSPQLEALHSYALPAENSCGLPNNTSLQFMGEYLHAFEDTFSHRDKSDRPIDAVWHIFGKEWGIGHGLYGYEPDYTYDTKSWKMREARTFEMEQETYAKMTTYMATMNYNQDPSRLGKVTSLNNTILVSAIQKFNSTAASEESGDMGKKIEVLNTALANLGYAQTLQWARERGGENDYNVDDAKTNRLRNLAGLDKADYPAALLP